MSNERKTRKKHYVEFEAGLVTFDTAKLAKEKECKIEGTVLVYDAQGNLTLDIGVNNEDIGMNHESYDAPTLAQVQTWLRDTHDLHIITDRDNAGDWSGHVYDLKQPAPRQSVERTYYGYLSYEFALEMCLQLALKLIKPCTKN